MLICGCFSNTSQESPPDSAPVIITLPEAKMSAVDGMIAAQDNSGEMLFHKVGSLWQRVIVAAIDSHPDVSVLFKCEKSSIDDGIGSRREGRAWWMKLCVK